MPVETLLDLPTSVRDWRVMGRTIWLVLTIPIYALVAVTTAVGSLSVFVLSRNVELLVNVVLFGHESFGSRVLVLVRLYPLAGTAYTPIAGILLVTTAVFVGVDFGLLAYYLTTRRLSVRDGSGSVSGVLLGTLGAGCASCGSALLAGLFSMVGASGALALLPLDGLEFTLVAIVVLVLSIHWIVEGLRGGDVRGCPVDVETG